jgi:hypothetical protein
MTLIIIITIGRTGSTLLMNMLNINNKINILGEIYPLRLLEKILDHEKINRTDFKEKNQLKHIKTSPFYIPLNFNLESIIENYNDNITEDMTPTEKIFSLLPKNKNVGFKLLCDYDKIEFLLKNYDAKFIFLIRESSGLEKSMKRSGFKKKLKEINENNEKYIKIYNKHKNTHKLFLIKYRDICNETQNFKDLYKFLDIEYNQEYISRTKKQLCSYAQSRNVKNLVKKK